jgi:sarcosine oxidase, subunit gamma
MPEILAAAPRVGALERTQPIEHLPEISIQPLGAQARFVLRLSAEDAARVGQAAGMRLSQPINRASEAASRTAARLGPDEWLLLAPDADASACREQVVADLAGVFHALVDVSHRNVGITVAGRAAAAVLNAGCTLDLDRFEPGSVTRTLLGKAEIVLFRLADGGDGLPRFRIECWRSLGRYVHAFIAQEAAEYG